MTLNYRITHDTLLTLLRRVGKISQAPIFIHRTYGLNYYLLEVTMNVDNNLLQAFKRKHVNYLIP